MEVSVIVPCRNAAGTVGDQMAALAAQDYAGAWEVVVVDSASTDDSTAVVEGYRDQLPSLSIVTLTERANAARARNVGVDHARGDKLLFCDADDVVGRGWIVAMAEALDRAEFVAGRLDGQHVNTAEALRSRDLPQTDGLQQWPGWIAFAAGANLAMSRAVHQSLGGFDEGFDQLEDTDLCFRAQLRGHRLTFVGEAVVHYRLRNTLRGMYRQTRGYAEVSVALHRRFTPHGMPRPNWLRGLGAWVISGPRLLRVRDWEGFARWVSLLGWRVGRFRGSVRYRVLAF